MTLYNNRPALHQYSRADCMATLENAFCERRGKRYETYWVWDELGTLVVDMYYRLHPNFVVNRHGE